MLSRIFQAVLNNPEPVLAVALGKSLLIILVQITHDPLQVMRYLPPTLIQYLLTYPQPLFDNDAGSPSSLATYITTMKSTFASAGLSIPVSISDLAYGWQSSGDISSVQEAVDFFMINNFPYFSFDATDGGSDIAWNDFLGDMEYFESIAGGRPLLVTQVFPTIFSHSPYININ